MGSPGAKEWSDTTRDRRRDTTPDLDTIIDTAARLFHDRGYQNTTMQDLAGALGIAKPTLYSYIRSKSNILGRIFDRVLTEADALTGAAGNIEDPIEGLRHVITGMVHLSVTYRAHLGLFNGDLRELPANLRGRYRRGSVRFVESIQELVDRGQRAGRIRQDLDSIVVAYAVVGMTNWGIRWLGARGPLPVSNAAEQLVTIVLAGVVEDPG
ncbi:MAG: TetR/AcrR family transcriptional regulator [Mycobacterium sp.]